MQQIQIEKIHPHPDNPRLMFREDVISGIVEQLKKTKTFDPAYALLVRPVDDGYQILQGHHRLEAAKQAGLSEVPCWVREMSDDEGYMQLVLGNVQGELAPIEIGIHVFRAIEIHERGRMGGISEYARQIGRNRQDISSYRQGAEVLLYIKCKNNLTLYVNKAMQLAGIHEAPQELWFPLTEWIIKRENKKGEQKGASVSRTNDLVKEVCKYDIPELWQGIFLPLEEVGTRFISGQIPYKGSGEPTPAQVSTLINLADAIEKRIVAGMNNLDSEKFTYTVEKFHGWLVDGKGTYAWEKETLEQYYQDVVAEAEAAKKPTKPDAREGEWYRLDSHLLYCGDTGTEEFWGKLPQVSFAFADPPYNAEVAEWDVDFQWAHDWLTDKAEIVAVTPGIASIQDFFSGKTRMPYRWSMAAWIDNGMTRGKLGFGNWIYLALFSKEDSIHRQAQDFIKCSIRQIERENIKAGGPYKGKKPDELLEKLMGLFTEKGDTVIDPFLGSGTTLLIAEDLGRHCIGGEIQSEMCNVIIETWQEKTGQQAERIQIETNAI